LSNLDLAIAGSGSQGIRRPAKSFFSEVLLSSHKRRK
jgi:hypothetical protein